MPIGWLVNLAEAESYFEDERAYTPVWDALATDPLKTKGLEHAYNRIFYCDDFLIPASPSVAQLVILKKAQCEMAYYLFQHIRDEDRRKGIQAQGVIEAGIVKEVYDKDMLDELPFPPFVLVLLKPFSTKQAFYATDIDRDEEESVNEDVTDL